MQVNSNGINITPCSRPADLPSKSSGVGMVSFLPATSYQVFSRILEQPW